MNICEGQVCITYMRVMQGWSRCRSLAGNVEARGGYRQDGADDSGVA